jgi:chromosome segregation ATPase
VAVVVATVAAAGSTLARAWVDANEATLRAEEQAQALTVALEAARLKSAETAAGIRAIGSAATEAETSLGVLVGELDRYSVEADKAQAAARRQAEAALSATGRELELTRQRLAGLEAEQAAASRSITGLETYAERQAQIEQTTARVRDLEAQLAAGRAGLARQNDAIALAAEYRREEAEANEVLRRGDASAARRGGAAAQGGRRGSACGAGAGDGRGVARRRVPPGALRGCDRRGAGRAAPRGDDGRDRRADRGGRLLGDGVSVRRSGEGAGGAQQ